MILTTKNLFVQILWFAQLLITSITQISVTEENILYFWCDDFIKKTNRLRTNDRKSSFNPLLCDVAHFPVSVECER